MKETRPDTPTATDSMGGGAQAFVRALGIFFVGLKYLIVLIFAGAFFQGVFVVEEDEEAMVFRFGKLVRKGADQSPILTSGRLYWAWPTPIDEVKRIPARRPVTLTTDHFWLNEDPNAINPGTAAVDETAGLAPGQSGYCLTGDTNIIHMQWSVVYTVKDARKYYLEFFEGQVDRTGYDKTVKTTTDAIAEKLILNCLENAALTEVASWSVEDVLYKARTNEQGPSGRELLTAAVQARLEKLVNTLDLGVEIDQVMLTSRAPDATQAAFREVNNAANEYQVKLEEASSHERQIIAEAEGRASEILAQARSYKTRVIASVKADAAYFETVLEEYNKNPETMLTALYSDTVRDVLAKVENRYIIHASDGDQEVRLLLNPEPEKPTAGTSLR
ncbi:MAG: protease modulator HflK [Lentisphaeria bacterium]|nr:protease modulator HflK [Lentisphaeria bacterium]